MDKYETQLFDDGTEPTVRRIPKGCDQQGRYSEAADRDELGVQYPDKELRILEIAAALVLAVFAVVVVVMIAVPLWRMFHGS